MAKCKICKKERTDKEFSEGRERGQGFEGQCNWCMLNLW